ncbi:MAG: anaerobic ribonucleoside-triphosphate reductase activating protein [Acutalibacteraceae bacterium]|nr:anaerobic ribonucleoside-triphosphate reductase activating protein [Eubacterium sp.]
MNYGAIKKCDIANGVGVRTVLFVSGCTHHCKGCFQPETWNFDYGERYTNETEDEIIESLRPDYVDGITLLGGEPFEPENQRELVKLLRRIKKELPQKTVWSFSGFTYEELTGDSRAVCEVTNEMLSMLDVLVDGEFVEAKRNISLRFRGSENQRLIDMNKTRKEGKIVLWDK